MSTSAQTEVVVCDGFTIGTSGSIHAGRDYCSVIMEPGFSDGLPDDVLIVEDDPIIALDFEDTILGFGVKRVRTAASVARALGMIADRAPDFALLDVGLGREKSFAIAERLDALKIPFVFVTGYGAIAGLPAALSKKPTLPKPCPTDALEALLRRRPDVSVTG